MEVGIRQFHHDDCDNFFYAVSESVAHLSVWLPWCEQNYSKQLAKQWVDTRPQCWRQDTDYCFIIENKIDNQVLGSVGLSQVNRQHNKAQLGYWIRKSALGKGACTRACMLALRYAFATLNIHRVDIHIAVGNDASKAVVDRLGAPYEGIQRGSLKIRDKFHDAHSYGVLAVDMANMEASSFALDT